MCNQHNFYNLFIQTPEDVPDNFKPPFINTHAYSQTQTHILAEQRRQSASIFSPLFVAQRYIKYTSAALYRKTLGQRQVDGD